MRVFKQMAHPHSEECIVCHGERWQKQLPLAELPNGWYVNADQLPTWLTVMGYALFLAFGFVAILAVVQAMAR